MRNKRAIVETLGFLSRLRRDVRGNTLAIMAAMLIPIAALSGSAVDVARLYAVKTRLQQACDVGALAARKAMLLDASTLDTSPTGPGQSFFKNNFREGWFKTSSVHFIPTLTADNQVAATADATVPMAVMGMFGIGARTLSVTCEARYDVADADIVFVLDTTGSMACLTSDSISTCNSYAGNAGNMTTNADGSFSVNEKTNSRIAGLRSAVAGFYTTLTTHVDPSTHLRFGFVPYNATVNVGSLLPTAYIATNWSYQTRASNEINTGTATNTTTTNTSQTACNALASKTYSTVSGNNPPYTGVNTTVTWTSASGGTCKKTVQNFKVSFHYAQSSIDVSGYVASLSTGVGVTNPAMIDGSKSIWAGCIEERIDPGTPVASPSTTSPPRDLDVDSAPSTANSGWGPLWPEIEFWRNGATSEDNTAYRTTLARSTTANDTSAKGNNEVPCPKPSRRLQTMTATDITDYLSASNGFRPYGLTYHDVGITWGTRLLSPNGIFKDDTAAWPGHNPPNRYIIFLTDGDLETNAVAYTSHGMEQFDKRVLGSASTSNLTTYHNNRFAAACTIAKNHNITIFVIAYAQTMTTTLQNCASPNQAYYASDTTALNQAFGQIAQQVAMLRISK